MQKLMPDIEVLDGAINAFITVTREQALADAHRCEQDILLGSY